MLFESSYGTPEFSEARMLGKSLYLPHNPLLSPSIVRNLYAAQQERHGLIAR